MDSTLLRAGGDGDVPTLKAMALDGLLIQLTETCWAPAGAPVDARVRALALGPPELARTVYSHGTAHWLWWGSARAPVTLSVTTRVRRRLRGSDALHVYERRVDDDDIATIGDVPVTVPARTLLDEALDAHRERTGDPDVWRTARFLAALLADVADGDAAEFRRRVALPSRKPGITAVRAGLAVLDA